MLTATHTLASINLDALSSITLLAEAASLRNNFTSFSTDSKTSALRFALVAMDSSACISRTRNACCPSIEPAAATSALDSFPDS